MARHERVALDERATVTRADGPETCGDVGPFGVACTEPAGHSGGHQYHAEGARASWQRE